MHPGTAVNNLRRPELLLPAGSPETLRTAVHYGADAVYLGGEAFSLRAAAKNFSAAQLKEAVSYTHAHGCRIYVAANILAHEADLSDAVSWFSFLKEVRPDAILISDPGLFRIARQVCPEIDLHISTQANNTNSGTFLFWHELGAKRIVCGRELSLSEIARIRAAVPDTLEIEAFVHGAMCISYSGRCLMSNYLAGRDANQGACTHPCRWKYTVTEETRPGEFFPVYENERGTFLFSSRDLCMIDHIPDLLKAGIDSFKIEGRVKSALYTAVCARAYRIAIDTFFEDPQCYAAQTDAYLEEVCSCTHRPYCTGFYYGKPSADAQMYDAPAYTQEYTYLGCAEEILPDGRIRLTQKNKFSVGETIEILRTNGENTPVAVTAIFDENGGTMQSAPHAAQIVYVTLSAGTEPPSAGDLFRRKG